MMQLQHSEGIFKRVYIPLCYKQGNKKRLVNAIDAKTIIQSLDV